MRTHIRIPSRGMTLVELLVVVSIVGLLAVAVAPLLQNRTSNRKLAAASDQVAAHCSMAVAQSIGSPNGIGIWLEPETTGAGSDFAVVSLGLSRARPTTTGFATITSINPASPSSPGWASLNITSPSPFPLPLAPLIDRNSTVITFQGLPARYRLASTAIIELLPNCSEENAAFPALNVSLPFSIDLPPRRKFSASTPSLGGDACVDFSASTIGVNGFTPAASVINLAGVRILCVLFDGIGRPTTAWLASDRVATTSTSWRRVALGPSTPVALLVGKRSQIGEPVAMPPTADSPGPNIQSPDSVWVVIDPRTSVVRTVGNIGATNVVAAQAPVAEALSNRITAF